MSDFAIQSSSSVILTDSSAASVKTKATVTEARNTSLQGEDSATINKTGSEAFAARTKAPKVDVLEGAKVGAKTHAGAGAIIGGTAGLLGSLVLAGAIASMNNGFKPVMILGVAAGTAVGAGVGAGVGGIYGAAEGAVFSKLSGGSPTKGAVAGGVIGGALGLTAFKKGTTEGIIAVVGGAAIGSYVGYKATKAAIK
jgi:hypothetical protein